MSRFYDIDLARLPPLPLGTESFETIRAGFNAELITRLAEEGFGYDVAMLESDPLVRASSRAGAVHVMMALARRDDSVRAVMLATSFGAYLDHLGATQIPPVARKAMVDAPRAYVTNPEDWEGDDPFRRRIQLAPEALSTAGPEGAYLFFALQVPGVLAASCYGPRKFGGTIAKPFTGLGEVRIPIVANTGDGTASPALVQAVAAAVNDAERRPLADFVTVSAAVIVPYRIRAVLQVGPGADGDLVAAQALTRLSAQALRQHRPGAAALRQHFYAAAGVTGSDGAIIVERVDLLEPADDVNAAVISPDSPAGAYRAPFCVGIDVTWEVADG